MNALLKPTLLLLVCLWSANASSQSNRAASRISANPCGAYLHIPFCRRRCFYCDFPIKVIGDRESTQRRETEAYVHLLLREIDSAAKTAAGPRSSMEALETVYFGGGTPSLLSPEQIHTVLSRLNDAFGVGASAEVTLEMDPGTFDQAKLEGYLRAGVNRVSMGVQSFDQKVLESCGRAHSAADVERAIADMHAASVDNFSLDLISSLPGVTEELWRETLRKAVASGCSHVSVYDLQIEEKTAFGRWFSPGQFPLPTDGQAAAMYAAAVEELSGIFEHYEVSNYARPGKRSRHNQHYWRCSSVWGFGLGAASFVDNSRATRPSSLATYSDWVTAAEERGYAAAVEALPGRERGDVLDGIMLALRTADGLDLAALHPNDAQRVLHGVQDFIGGGCPLVALSQNGNLRLTDPHGFLLSNDVISNVFAQF